MHTPQVNDYLDINSQDDPLNACYLHIPNISVKVPNMFIKTFTAKYDQLITDVVYKLKMTHTYIRVQYS